MEDRIEKELKKIRDEVINCKKCSLYKTRTYPVIGQGNHQAKIIFIGEAPGVQEDRTGRPFCGAAGKILDELLELVGIKREEIYICNILKCRPPNNCDPRLEEIRVCTPYLEKQIKVINPEVISTLGNFATSYVLEKFGLRDKIQGISKIHGQIFNTNGLKIIPFYHPAVVAYNNSMKETLKKDFKILEKFK